MAEGHRERMRGRVRQHGLNSLFPHEILEFLLFPLIPRKATNDLAHRLIDQFGSLDSVLSATEGELLTVKGVPPMAALYLPAMRDAVRSAELDAKARVVAFNNMQSLWDYFITLFRGVKEERITFMALDAAKVMIKTETLATGSASEVVFEMSKVARFALDSRAKYVIMCHNHSYGTVAPSEADLAATRNIHALLYNIGVFLYDSIIIGETEYFSFRLAGAIGGTPEEQRKLSFKSVDYFYENFLQRSKEPRKELYWKEIG